MPGTNLTRAEATERADLLEVDSYEIDLDLREGGATFGTTTTVRFSCRRPGADTFIDFVGEGVTRATLNGREVDVSGYSDSRLALTGLAASNVLVVEAIGRYTNTGEGMHQFVDPVDGERYLYSQFEVPDSRRVFAVFEQPDLKATFQFTATVPQQWIVLSNQPTPEPVGADGGGRTWRFEPTPRLSSYVTALCAGPYVGWHDTYDGIEAQVPLGIYARSSLAEFVDHEELFDITKRGFAFFEKEFACAYPFAKYDQLFAPEYNAGAMENAGMVTITELYVFRGQAPEPTVERRALTILHEQAHMWFGDLVTMQWWDDLWLNESFAEWASAVSQAEATRWTEAWTTFHSHEKTWAYQQDQQPDTHPVYADMRDLDDVAVNFDGITYAKGGSVLKQLVAYVGREPFVTGLREYFRKHAWGNTTMDDLFAELQTASGRDLSDWGERWLRTAGVNTLAVETDVDDSGVITAARLRQTAIEAHPTLRPHRLGIGRYDLRDGHLVRVGFDEVDIDGPVTDLPGLVGHPMPDLLLPNDGDLTYAKLRLDERSLQTVLKHPTALTDSLAASLVTGSLWEMMREGTLAPQQFLDHLLGVLPVTEHPTVLRTIVTTTKQIPSMLLATVRWFLPEAMRADARERAVRVVRDCLDSAEPGSDRQLQLLSSYATLSTDPHDTDRIRGALSGSDPLPGLQVDQDLRWGLLFALSAAGAASEDDIAAEQRRDPSVAGTELAMAARAAMPTAEAKATAWRLAIEQDDASNAAMEHLGKGFRRANDPQELLAPYVERYHEMLEPLYRSRSFAIAERAVKYFYPLDLAGPELVERSRRWLDENPEAPAGLRRLLIEQLDLMETALRTQQRAMQA